MSHCSGLASILVPVYNKEEYLHKCIESLRNQTYENIEIVLVDDGSTDNSLSVCRKYADMDKRICVVHQENQGVCGARNTCLNNAHGDYIFWVDPDDFVEISLVKDAVEVMKESKADAVLFGVNIMNGEKHAGVRDWNCNMDSDQLKVITGAVVGWELWGRAYRKHVWKDISFQKNMRTCEDVFVSGPLMKNIQKIVAISGHYYYWQRESHGSLVQTRKARSYIDEFIAWKHNLDVGIFSDLQRRICEVRTLIACLKAILKNRKDHSIPASDLDQIHQYYTEHSHKPISPAVLLFYEYEEESLSAKALGFVDEGPMKKALKLYSIDSVHPIMEAEERETLKNFLKENQLVPLKKKYSMIESAIIQDYSFLYRMFGRMIWKKYK